MLSEGRLLNLGNATGHPSFVMSNSFTNQTIAQVELFTKNDDYEKRVYVLPKHLDEKVARLHLDALGAKLTELSPEQAAYIGVSVEGPYQVRPLPLLVRKSEISPIQALAPQGRARVDWAEGQMPVLRSIRERFADSQPLAGAKVAACLHVTAETANLMKALAAGGAEPALCSANPLTTQDEVAAALVEDGIPVLAARGEDIEAYVKHVHALAAWAPDITLDDGADLLVLLHEQGKADAVRGGAEETTTGLLRCAGSRRRGGSRAR